jgi:TrmH family RNA methyltransferase
MLSKNQIKLVGSLKQKKFRDEQQLFIAEGTKIVPELLASSIKVQQVYATSDFLSRHEIPSGIEVVEVKPAELDRISLLSAPNEVLAVCHVPHYPEYAGAGKGLTLMLDDIKDPGNLGTIIRIADWFGISDIVCSKETVEAFNPKVVQSTMGSIARVRVHYADLEKLLSSQNSVEVYGALLEGKNIYKEELSSDGIIMIGNESRGISLALQKYITRKISIPSFSNMKGIGGEAESLNAAIATSIICSEFRRR